MPDDSIGTRAPGCRGGLRRAAVVALLCTLPLMRLRALQLGRISLHLRAALLSIQPRLTRLALRLRRLCALYLEPRQRVGERLLRLGDVELRLLRLLLLLSRVFLRGGRALVLLLGTVLRAARAAHLLIRRARRASKSERRDTKEHPSHGFLLILLGLQIYRVGQRAGNAEGSITGAP